MQDVECGVGDVLLYLVMAPLSLSLSLSEYWLDSA